MTLDAAEFVGGKVVVKLEATVLIVPAHDAVSGEDRRVKAHFDQIVHFDRRHTHAGHPGQHFVILVQSGNNLQVNRTRAVAFSVVEGILTLVTAELASPASVPQICPALQAPYVLRSLDDFVSVFHSSNDFGPANIV